MGADDMSNSGWITSILKTELFCHRFSTRRIFSYNHTHRHPSPNPGVRECEGGSVKDCEVPDLQVDTGIDTGMWTSCSSGTAVQRHLYQNQIDDETVEL